MAGLSGVILLLCAANARVLLSKPQQGPKCSYSVKAIQFGFQIKMINSTRGNYTIDVTEKESPYERKATGFFFNETSTHNISRLKPCTEYKLRVRLNVSNATDIFCSTTENKTVSTISTKTTGMTGKDISKTSCPSGYFCYQSGWDISSLLSGNNKVSAVQFINGSYRIKPAYESICSELVLKFPQEKCTNITFNRTENVPFDFIDPNNVDQPEPTELPANIEPKLPPKCRNFSVEYKCSGMNNVSVKPFDMKPFTNYSCTGDIKNNNGSVLKTLPPVQFNVACNFSISNLQKSPTNTSIKLSWDTTSDKCQGILHNLTELSYGCSCLPKYEHGATEVKVDLTTCNINGLKPYEDYSCTVHAIYNEKRFQDTTETVKTKPGIPNSPTNIEITFPQNNKIKVTCGIQSHEFYGPDRESYYVARLHNVGRDQRSKKCDFEFKDLSYLTLYTVEVITDNGHHKSAPATKDATTYYNDKALIGFLIFLINITSVALLLVLYKIYVLKHRKSQDLTENISLVFIRKMRKYRNVDEEQKLFSIVIYTNMPPPKLTKGH